MTYKTLPTPSKTNQQVREYTTAVKKGMAGRFVIQNGKGWYVREPISKTGKLFPTKQAAIAEAKQELAKTKGELFVFDSAGNLIDRQ